MRYFAGLTVEETAEALGLPTITVKREWLFQGMAAPGAVRQGGIMTPERWARISKFLRRPSKGAGRAVPVPRRGCGSDASLRVEVERLLAEPQDSWLKNPMEADPRRS